MKSAFADGFFKDIGKLVREFPGDLSGVPLWGAFSLSAGFLGSALDEKIFELLGRDKVLGFWMSLPGDGRVIAGLGIPAYFVFLVLGKRDVSDAFLRALANSLYVSFWVQSFKFVGRARPFAREGNMSFRPPAFEERYRSFPSGHVGAAGAFWFSLARECKPLWCKFGLSLLPVVTALGRIFDRAHWFSDTLTSLLFSWFFVWDVK